VRQIVLNIPVAGMEEITRAVGGCTGGDGDKLDRLSLPLCKPGWRPMVTPTSIIPSSSSTTDSAVAALPSTDTTTTTASTETKQTMSQADIAAERIRRKREAMTEQKRVAASMVGNEHVHDEDIAIASTCAHIVCSVTNIINDQIPGHLLLICQAEAGWVRSDYWPHAGCFAPISSLVPPYLTFLGGGKFAYTSATPNAIATNAIPTPTPPSSTTANESPSDASLTTVMT
jgi:hypothetical protein